jgi:hypothetical protein
VFDVVLIERSRIMKNDNVGCEERILILSNCVSMCVCVRNMNVCLSANKESIYSLFVVVVVVVVVCCCFL